MASAQPDDIKGRIKEAAGALTDNDDLKREGKADQAAGSIKEGLDKVRDKIEDGVDAIKDRINKD
ncbi:MAG TPA: CsbD family protein [Ilumatobacteraceae bacterium]|nr:CsbD family protein [Ilumatobacteraceae bacterium]